MKFLKKIIWNSETLEVVSREFSDYVGPCDLCAGAINFTEPTVGQLDAGFDYGRPNVSINAAVITTQITGVSFGLTQSGSSKLPDALTVALTVDSGTVTGQPTVAIEGTCDGTNWGAILPAISTNFATSSTQLVAISAHSGSGVPTHLLGVRVRITSGGTGTGKLTAVVLA